MPLQKSFSDQNHSSRQNNQTRRPYQPQKSWAAGPQHPPRSNLANAPTPLAEKPPLPVNPKSKKILSTFQFREGPKPVGSAKQETIDLVSSDAAGQENARVKESATESEEETGAKRAARRISTDDSGLQIGSEIKTTPATPAKLEFDPTSNADLFRPFKDVSPDERILWDAHKDVKAIPTPRPRTAKRKRGERDARSSSPIMEHLVNATPIAGPELSMWQLPAKDHSLSHIMQLSSPQTSRDGSISRTLTRSTSLGNPSKRTQTSRLGSKENTTPGLLKRLKATMEMTFEPPISDPPSLPSSSNPEANHSHDDEPSSPSQPSRAEIDTPSLQVSPKPSFPARQEDAKYSRRKVTPSSDYGSDDGLDEIGDLLDVIATQSGELPTAIQKPAPQVLLSNALTPFDPAAHTSRPLKAVHPVPQQNASRSFPTAKPTNPLQQRNASRSFQSSRPLIGRTLHQPSRPPSQPTPSRIPNRAASLIKLAPPAVDHTTSICTIPPQLVEDDEFDEGLDDSDFAAVSGVTAALSVIEATASGRPKQAARAIAAESDDEYGEGFDDADFEEAVAATQSIQPTANNLIPFVKKVNAIQRYLVTSIVPSEYEGPRGRMLSEKMLVLKIENTKIKKLVLLRGVWVETPATINAFVHIIGDFDLQGHCIIDDTQNMIILHPDHLISATSVADSFECTRRAVLQNRVKATSASSPPLVYGTILHEIFQAAILANRWESDWLHEVIESIATKHLEDLYVNDIQLPQAVEYLKSKMDELQSWAKAFISPYPKNEAVVEAGNGETAVVCVSKLLDVEEHVWSPMYGLKGNIDATVQITMRDKSQTRTLTVPFEVKTGRNPTPSHQAQTALYNLLISDRYDIEVACGILYYMETSKTKQINVKRHELQHMIMQRNELACFVRERHTQLPPMLKKEHLCNRCYAKETCFIYHKLADDGTGETSGMKAKFDEVVQHLTPIHKEFFLKWDDLLTKEEKESLKYRRELWTMLSSERERLGRCFSNVVIEPGSVFEEKEEMGPERINRYQYTLIKETPRQDFSFVDSQITVGEPIVISDEEGHFALANGFVTKVRKSRISVAVDRRLHNARIRQPGFNEIRNQVFASVMEVVPNTPCTSSAGPIIQYRLDKDEFSNGLATVRSNLVQVMAKDSFGSREIRNLVVDLVEPRFKTQATAYTLQDRASINIDQRRAIDKVMSAEDYALVLGMPGTGKTTTIAHIIRALVSQGKSVLLTSYTHSAVDNILLKLKDDNIGTLRLGRLASIHPEVREYAQVAATPKGSFEEIKSAWHDNPIVATTCLSINHPLFQERIFDYCIVDEASQITLPVCIGPIRMARTFILVGDHNQLPPLVQNEEARAGGLDISLFKHLSDAHPSSVVYLEHQYRMCADIMALSNKLIYSGRLKCGSQKVADRSIDIPDMSALRNNHHSPSNISHSTQKAICPGPTPGRCWLRDLLDPATKVSFINTDSLLPLSREEKKGNRIVNPTEANVVMQLVESFLSVGVPASSIGIMTHYRSQLALLKDKLHSKGDGKLEMHTADRFQGRDKEVIILSLVRSNSEGNIGELLKDWRRINVAFTRAKTKLLVVGSRETLKGRGEQGEKEMVSQFVGLMEERGWVYNLGREALGEHWFEETTTTQGTSASSRPAPTQKRALAVSHVERGGKKTKRDSAPGKENIGPKGTKQPAKRILGGPRGFVPATGSVLGNLLNELGE